MKKDTENLITGRHGFASVIKHISLDYPVIYMIIVLCIFMAIQNPNFFSLQNIISTFTSYAYFTVGAIGLVFVFISGNSGIDLSIGNVAAFSAVISTSVMSALNDKGTMNPWLIILLGLFISVGIGMAFGLFNGIAIAKFNIAPFIITLATQLLSLGLSYVYTNGYTVSGAPRELSQLSTLIGIRIGDNIIPAAAILPFVLIIIMALIQRKTTFGRQVVLTGSNPSSAEHAGISPKKMYLIVYVISGFFAGLTGMFVPMCIGAVNPDVGTTFLMPMVAAVTIGGVSQTGGYGNMLQAFLGIIFIILLMSVMTFLGFGLPIQQLAYGVVIVFTMTLLGYLEKKRFRN